MRFRISKSKYENWRSGISNGRIKLKFANFRNQILVFQIKKKNSKNFPNFTISKIIKFPLSKNL